MNLLILADIANAFATLATNPALADKAHEIVPIVNLVGLAFQAIGMNDTDRQILLQQIRDANRENRALTDAEMEVWKARHAAAKKIIQDWRATLPPS